MASLFLYGKSKVLLLVSGRRYLQRGHNSSHFGLKQPLFFLVWHPPCFRLLIDIWRICPVHAWKLLTSCQHDQICKKLENGSRKQGFVWCGVFLQCSEIESDSFEIFQSQFGNPRISPFEFLWCMPADRRNKALECWLATLNASSAIMSHALEQINAARIGVICQSASLKLPTSCFHGCSVSLPRNTPDCPGCSNSHLALENEGWKMPLFHFYFKYGILPGSFRAWCGDFPFRRCVSTRTLSSNRGRLTGTSWDWRVCPLQA